MKNIRLKLASEGTEDTSQLLKQELEKARRECKKQTELINSQQEEIELLHHHIGILEELKSSERDMPQRFRDVNQIIEKEKIGKNGAGLAKKFVKICKNT